MSSLWVPHFLRESSSLLVDLSRFKPIFSKRHPNLIKTDIATPILKQARWRVLRSTWIYIYIYIYILMHPWVSRARSRLFLIAQPQLHHHLESTTPIARLGYPYQNQPPLSHFMHILLSSPPFGNLYFRGVVTTMGSTFRALKSSKKLTFT